MKTNKNANDLPVLKNFGITQSKMSTTLKNVGYDYVLSFDMGGGYEMPFSTVN